MHDVYRRAGLIAAAAACFGLAGPGGARAQAAAPQRPVRALGVFSLLSDVIDVSVNERPVTDTRIESTKREALPVSGVGFDAIVLREVSELARRLLPEARLSLYQPKVVISAAEQRAIAAGARRAELPAWIVQAIEAQGLSHLLLVTRARTDAALPTPDKVTIGRGRVEGIGYYVDPMFEVRDENTGALANGALGAFVLLDLQLMEVASGDVVRSEVIREQLLIGAQESRAEVDPWSYLGATEKVELLRRLVTQGLRRQLPAVLRPA